MLETNELTFKYRLQKINTSQFFINDTKNSLQINDNYPLEFSINITIDSIQEIVTISMGVLISNNPPSKEKLCNLVVDFTFHVLGIKDAEKNGDTIKIPDNFLTSLLSISYGTIRGIFYEKCSTTCLANTILPVIDPAILLPKQK